MKQTLITNSAALHGTLRVPSDKSISHRAALLGSMAQGRTVIRHYLDAEDTMNTLYAMRQLGVSWEKEGNTITLEGKKAQFESPQQCINIGNSGTSIRLLSGVLASVPQSFTLTGDASIQKRPMERIITPLHLMGAEISGKEGSEYPPLTISGGHLHGITYHMPIASAQVKSAILLAGLKAEGETVVFEKALSRNHTEEMIPLFGGSIQVEGKKIALSGNQSLQGTELSVPGDISSAAFFIVAALIVPHSEIRLTNVNLNPTRSGILNVIQKMGGRIDVEKVQGMQGDLIVRYQPLHGTVIEGDLIPTLIDEIPIIALLATQAEGDTIIRDAKELRVKESDRIHTITEELTKLGAKITEIDDGLIIHGPTPLRSAVVDSHYDHRIGMMLSIAALICDGGAMTLENSDSIAVSYRHFFTDLSHLIG